MWRTVLGGDRESQSEDADDLRRLWDLSGYKPVRTMHKEAGAGHTARVWYLLQEKGVNLRDKENRTALHYACAYGHPEVVTLLIQEGCDINARDSRNSTALIKASQCQHEECVDLLLHHGADPNAQDVHGNTALHYAVYHDSTSIPAKLLAHNANIEAKNEDGETPLLLAAKEKKLQAAEFLIKKEADVDAVDVLRRSALMYAVRHESESTMELLLQRNANCCAADIFRKTAIDYADDNPCTVSKQVLLRYTGRKPIKFWISNPADKSTEENALSRLPNKPATDEPGPSSKKDDYNFDAKDGATPLLDPLEEQEQQMTESSAKKEAGARAAELERPAKKKSKEKHKLQNAQEQHAKTAESADKMQDRLLKLVTAYSEVKVALKMQIEKTEQLQKNLPSANLIDGLEEKWETLFSKLLCLDVKLERIEQELLSIKAALDKYQDLDKNQKKLEEEVLSLKSHLQENTK